MRGPGSGVEYACGQAHVACFGIRRENGYIVAKSNPRSVVRPPKVARAAAIYVERGIEFSG
jgi:hypothetical protein